MSTPTLGVEEIDRKYEVLGVLGEGGMGAIYKVRHILLEEVRVIKMIRSQLKGEEEHEARFLREAKMASRLRHPGIAQTFDFGIGEEGSAYIVMEFIDGRDLSELLADGDTFSLKQCSQIAAQTLEVLGYLHGKRYVHRDISPDNIMLTQDESGGLQVKLIDLGIAKSLEASQFKTRTGLFVGKLKYASPEQLGGTEKEIEVGPGSDLYSFGLVMYQLLTGQFPVAGETEAAIIAGHLFHQPRAFDETDPDGRVPDEVRTAVLKSLAKSPGERFENAREFRKALQAAWPETASPEKDLDITVDRTVVLPKPVPSRPAPAAVERTVATGQAPRSWLRSRWLVGGLVALGLAVAGTVLWQSVGSRGPDLGSAAGGLRPGGPPERRLGPPPGDRRPPPQGDLAALADISFGTYHALVIGNNEYESLPPLKTAATDAREMAELLESRFGFEVQLLTDATRYEIITAFTELAGSLTASDNLLVYYAGHGWLDPQNQSGYWQPVDADPFNTANWVSTRYEISSVLGRLPVKQVLVIADSCYSGSLVESIASPPPPFGAGRDFAEDVRQTLARRSRLALTSGGLSPVLDQGDGRHSVFSKALLEALGGAPGLVATSRIFPELRRQVGQAAAQYGVEQSPVLAPIPQAGDEGGEFFFVPSTG